MKSMKQAFRNHAIPSHCKSASGLSGLSGLSEQPALIYASTLSPCKAIWKLIIQHFRVSRSINRTTFRDIKFLVTLELIIVIVSLLLILTGIIIYILYYVL